MRYDDSRVSRRVGCRLSFTRSPFHPFVREVRTDGEPRIFRH